VAGKKKKTTKGGTSFLSRAINPLSWGRSSSAGKKESIDPGEGDLSAFIVEIYAAWNDGAVGAVQVERSRH
jgi:hypothetical protein